MLVQDFRGSVVQEYPLVSRRITRQTGKGKRHRQYALTVLGYGEGKHDEYGKTRSKGHPQHEPYQCSEGDLHDNTGGECAAVDGEWD